MGGFEDFKKKNLLKKIDNEFQKNWKEDYFNNLKKREKPTVDRALKAVNDYKSGIIDLNNYKTYGLELDFSMTKGFREEQIRIEKEIQNQDILQERKAIINDIVNEFQKNWKESYNNNVKIDAVEELCIDDFLFIIENYKKDANNFPQYELIELELILKTVRGFIERQIKKETKEKQKSAAAPKDTDNKKTPNKDEIYITYSITAPLSTQEDYITRQVAMEEIWSKTTEIMGIEYEYGIDYKGIFSGRAYDIEYVNTNGILCKVMSDFIIFNGVSTVTHGEIKKNVFQITISGNDIINISKKIMKNLKDCSFDNTPYNKDIKFIDEPFVYIRKKEILDTTNAMIRKTSEFLGKNKGNNKYSEEIDEDEESEEYEDDDEIDEDDYIIELCQFFSVEYPDFEATALKKSYRKMMTQYHPDKVASLADDFKKLAEQKTKEINEKYECLLAWVEERQND